MLTLFHLERSQSERILWLLEEMEQELELRTFRRDPATQLAPPALEQVHPLGFAPVLTDGDVTIAESGAIIDYIFARYGDRGLRPAAGDPGFPDYLYWFHYANGSLMLQAGVNFAVAMAAGGDTQNPVVQAMEARMARHLDWVDARLGRAPYFAGDAFSAADIMMHFPFSTMRGFHVVEIGGRANIRAWLRRISERPAYQAAMRKAGHAADPAAHAT